MNSTLGLRKLSLFATALVLLRPARLFAELPATAAAAFDFYARSVESRLAQQHTSPSTFLVLPTTPAALAQIRSGQPLVEQLPAPATRGALIHHWRATAFVPQATPADFEHLLQNYSAYPHIFAPQIVSSTVLSHTGAPGGRSVFAGVDSPTDTTLRLRTRQHHVITVVLDTTYDVTFGSLDPTHRYSISRSTHINEIASPGTPSEHALSPSEEHGFLYRLDTYWSYEQRDGGLYLQIESISLTRDVPRGLGWAIQPYLESIPRESLVFTLTSARNALTKSQLKTAN